MCKFTSYLSALRINLLLSLYVCDIPEAEETCVFQAWRADCGSMLQLSSCQDVMPLSTEYMKRSIRETLRMVEMRARDDEKVVEEFNSISMLSSDPVLSCFPFVGIYPSIDIYNMFRYEPMHKIGLGISNLLKKGMVNMLRTKRTTIYYEQLREWSYILENS